MTAGSLPAPFLWVVLRGDVRASFVWTFIPVYAFPLVIRGGFRQDMRHQIEEIEGRPRYLVVRGANGASALSRNPLNPD